LGGGGGGEGLKTVVYGRLGETFRYWEGRKRNKQYIGKLDQRKERDKRRREDKTRNGEGDYFMELRFRHECVLNIMVIGHYTINIFQVLMMF